MRRKRKALGRRPRAFLWLFLLQQHTKTKENFFFFCRAGGKKEKETGNVVGGKKRGKRDVMPQQVVGGDMKKIGQGHQNRKRRLGAAAFVVGDGRRAIVEQ